MKDTFYPGRRLSYDGFLCTVRYVGPLEGTSGEWLGVEWDESSRGKHSGKHKGQQIFQCLSSALIAGSFVKSSRKFDTEQTVIEAIKSKYGNVDSADHDIVVISGKVAEEVGFHKIAQEQARLADLRIILIDQMVVNGIAARTASADEIRHAQEVLRKTCPNISEIDLGWNTFESWTDIALVCAALPRLKVLKVGGSRFNAFAGEVANAFSYVTSLSLEQCLVRPNQLFEILGNGQFPNLEQLEIAGNELTEITVPTLQTIPSLPSVKTIDLSNNQFRDFQCMTTLRKAFPNLQSISLQANSISSVGDLPQDSDTFSKIDSINVSLNDIAAFDFVDTLPRSFPNLQSLHTTQNPFFVPTEDAAVPDSRASDKKYYLTVARIASLQVLNHAKISARDREEGEIYYLSVADEMIKNEVKTSDDRHQAIEHAKHLFPRYDQLAKKYNHESLIEKYLHGPSDEAILREAVPGKAEYPTGSLGARLVTATFYVKEQASESSTTIRLPSSIPVTRVMALLMQNTTFKGHLRPLQFKLVYESKELDPVETTAESTTRSATYGRRLTFEQKKALWQEWGDWDADAMVALLTRERTSGPDSEGLSESNHHWIEDGTVCMRQGRRFKPREVEIPSALKRPWGDWLEGSKEVRIRIEPYELS